MSIVYKCEQGTMEWYRLRIGIPTSSMFHKIVTPGGKISEQRFGYMNRLIAERLLMESMDTPISVEWIERGKELEPNAAAHFQFMTELQVEKVGFVTTNDGRLGCSPDRLVKGKSEAVELKAPAPWTHIGYLREGMGTDYKPQVNGQMLVGDFDAIHFYSYSDRGPAFYRITRPDAAYMKALASGLAQFCEELDAETERMRALGAWVANPGFTTPHEEASPPPDPLQIVIPE